MGGGLKFAFVVQSLYCDLYHLHLLSSLIVYQSTMLHALSILATLHFSLHQESDYIHF